MKLLHVKSLRHIFLAAGICIFGFLLAYLSGGMAALDTAGSLTSNTQTENSVSELPEKETEADDPASETESSSSEMANYHIRLTRGLSSSDEELLLTLPVELKTSVDYRGKTSSLTLTDSAEIEELLNLLQKAKRLPDDTTILSTSSSHAVSLTLPYTDGFGNLYVFEGYSDSSSKTMTYIQDNSNHLYETKSEVIDRLYDLIKPVETSLNAERLNVYSTRNYEKNILQAQSSKEEDYALLLSVLNSLEKQGSSLDLDAPDYMITLLPTNSVSENDYCYLWLDEKQLRIAFADDSITVYQSTEVTSSQMKKWIKEHSIK